MLTTRLTQRRVDTLKPRKQTHHVRDPSLTGFGVRILPSGSKRYFLHSQSDGKRIWHAIGDAGAITLESARSRARALLAARQNGNADNLDTCDSIPFETVADEVFGRYGRHWKPRALAVTLGYYRKQILLWFKGKPISDITHQGDQPGILGQADDVADIVALAPAEQLPTAEAGVRAHDNARLGRGLGAGA